MIRTDNVLISPIVTEKTVAMSDRWVFLVHPDATKTIIKQAIKDFYGVEVEKVNIVKTPLKSRIIGRGRSMTRRKAQKKAIVTLKGGKTLDFNAFK